VLQVSTATAAFEMEVCDHPFCLLSTHNESRGRPTLSTLTLVYQPSSEKAGELRRSIEEQRSKSRELHHCIADSERREGSARLPCSSNSPT